MRLGLALWLSYLKRAPLLIVLILYTTVTGGPFLWVAAMSLRTTAEIFDSRYALPTIWHWSKFADAWTKANYGTYFWNDPREAISAVFMAAAPGAIRLRYRQLLRNLVYGALT